MGPESQNALAGLFRKVRNVHTTLLGISQGSGDSWHNDFPMDGLAPLEFIHVTRCGETMSINSREVITFVFFQNFGKCR